MLIQAITIFPEMFDSIVEYGVTGRARKQNLWQFQAINPRKFADNKTLAISMIAPSEVVRE